MKLTNSAIDAILHVMKSREMNPADWYLEFKLLNNGAVGLGFTKQAAQQILTFGELRLTVDGMIDTQGVVLDYSEVNGKQGLLFAAEDLVTGANEPNEHTTHMCSGGTGINCCGGNDGGCPCANT